MHWINFTEERFRDQFPETVKRIGEGNVKKAVDHLNKLSSKGFHGSFQSAIQLENVYRKNASASSEEIIKITKDMLKVKT